MLESYKKAPYAAALAIVMGLGTMPAFAACPWPNNTAACSRWEALLQRLETAAKRTETAAPPPTAATATPQETQARAVIDGFLRYLPAALPQKAGGFELKRDYVLTQQQDGRYTTTFANAAWVQGSTRVNFGPLTFFVQPQDQNLSQLSFRFGDTITLQEGDRVQALLVLGEQDNQGTWNAALKNLTASHARLTKISLLMPDKPLLMDIARLDAEQGLTRNPDDTWSNRGNLTMNDLTILGQPQTLHLANLTGQFSLDGRQYEKFADLNTLFQAFLQDNLEQDKQAAQAAVAKLSEWYDLFSRSDVNLTATGLTLNEAEQPAMQIGRFTLTSHFDEGDASGSRFNYKIELADAKTPSPGAPSELVPTDIHFEFGLVNIPPRLMTRLTEINLAAEQLPEPERETYLQQQFSELFLNSRAGMYIKDSFIKAPQMRLEINFQAAVDPKTALGGTGEMLLRAEGLQKLLEGSGAALAGQGGASFLAMLVALSERTEEAGKVIDRFRLKLTPEGKLLLNDKDISALLAPAPQTPGQAAPPQKRP